MPHLPPLLRYESYTIMLSTYISPRIIKKSDNNTVVGKQNKTKTSEFLFPQSKTSWSSAGGRFNKDLPILSFLNGQFHHIASVSC